MRVATDEGIRLYAPATGTSGRRWAIIRLMSIEAFVITTLDGEVVRGIADPTGGTCDAAGDLDRLIPTNSGGFLDEVNPHGDVSFGAWHTKRILAEVAALLDRIDLSGTEQRGLLRLRALAEYVVEGAHRSLCFRGD